MPHREYFKEILFMPNGRVLGDGRLIDRVKPSHTLPALIRRVTNPNTGTVPYWVTV